jgi:streptogramin lyase
VVDAGSGHVATVKNADNPQAVAAGYGSVWVANFADSTIERVDATAPDEKSVTIPLELSQPVAAGDRRFLPFDVTVGAGAVWASSARGYVARIDPASNRVAAMVKTTTHSTGPVVATDDAVWIGEGLQLGRIDPITNAVSRVVIDGPGSRRLNVGALVLSNGSLWVSGDWSRPSRDAVGHPDYTITGEAALAEVDAETGAVRSISPLDPGTALQGGDADKLWLTNTQKRTVYEFSPETRRITATAHVRAVGPVIAARGSRVWLASTKRELRSVRFVPTNAASR